MKKTILFINMILCAICAYSTNISINKISFENDKITRDTNAILNVSLDVAKNAKLENDSVSIYIEKDNQWIEYPKDPIRVKAPITQEALNDKKLKITITPENLKILWGNDRPLTSPGWYTISAGINKDTKLKSARLFVEEIFNRKTVPFFDEYGKRKEGKYEASYMDSNPFRDALLPVPESGFFKMEGYSLWCPAVIKVDDTYHMFCSRWALDSSWTKSHIIRATSKSLYGPYEFQEVVMQPKTFPYPWGQAGLHNPKIIKTNDNKYLLYYLALPNRGTGYAIADNIEGPWKIIDKPVININNPAMIIRDDGSAYVLGKDNVKTPDGKTIRYMRSFSAPNYIGPFTMLGDDKNRLPDAFQIEDPAIWWDNNQYNVLMTDWLGLITGEQKSVVYLTSKDGINFKLYSRQAIWRRSEPVPLEGGKSMLIAQVERPEVYINENGEVEALFVGAIDRPNNIKSHINYIMIRPVNKFKANNKD